MKGAETTGSKGMLRASTLRCLSLRGGVFGDLETGRGGCDNREAASEGYQ